MDRDDFKEALLGIMERKTHWAWPSFTSGLVPKERLHVHLEQEYATYVRDFPILVARAYIHCPIAAVRRELIENVYEEETGGIHAGRPHPDLFLEYPRGLGMDLSRFVQVTLLPAAHSYRAFLDEATLSRGWEVGAAVTTLFLEGTANERGELDGDGDGDGEASMPRRPPPALEEHPLVRHYGLPLDRLLLTKAHRAVEGEHRAAAWRVMLDHVESEVRPAVVESLECALSLWLGYRDGVAEACGLSRNG